MRGHSTSPCGPDLPHATRPFGGTVGRLIGESTPSSPSLALLLLGAGSDAPGDPAPQLNLSGDYEAVLQRARRGNRREETRAFAGKEDEAELNEQEAEAWAHGGFLGIKLM